MRASLLLVVCSLALFSGCAAKVPPPAPPISQPVGDGSGTHRFCFTSDNTATCIVKTPKSNGGTEVKLTSEPLN